MTDIVVPFYLEARPRPNPVPDGEYPYYLQVITTADRAVTGKANNRKFQIPSFDFMPYVVRRRAITGLSTAFVDTMVNLPNPLGDADLLTLTIMNKTEDDQSASMTFTGEMIKGVTEAAASDSPDNENSISVQCGNENAYYQIGRDNPRDVLLARSAAAATDEFIVTLYHQRIPPA